MTEELIQELAEITPEEKLLLYGESVDKTLYATGHNFEIDSAKLLEKNQLITIRPHTRFAPFPRHSHNFVEIMYMCKGSITHIINGGEPITLQPGELLFLGRHTSHAVHRAEVGDIAVNFIVLPQFFDIAFDMVGVNNVLGRFLMESLQAGGEELSYLHCRVANILPIQNLAESMIWNLLHREPNSRQINQVSMGLLFLQLLNHPETILTQGEKRYDRPLVLAALQEIEGNCRDAELSTVAERFGVSLAYLSTQIKRVTGSTFKELLQQKRLDKAQRLLRDTKLPVQEIIDAVGYENTSYFYRIFKDHFGITPKEYRLKLQQMLKSSKPSS